MNEIELKELGGQIALVKPSVEDKFNALMIIKDTQVKKDLDLKVVRDHLTDVLWKSIHVFDSDNKPTDKLIKGEEETTRTDIDAYVVTNLFELWVDYATKIGIIDEKKAKELESKMGDAEKKD